MKQEKQSIRLDKYLADMGTGTRQEVKKYIRQGRVRVDGRVVKEPEHKVFPDQSEITFDGFAVLYIRMEYLMLYKPAGVVTATKDRKDRTVMDLVPDRKRKDLFPVGRLDKDTEGLLLLTNDGELAHRLLSPKRHIDKCYFARVQGKVTQKDVEAFAGGVDIGTDSQSEITMPAKLEILQEDAVSEILLTIREGKYHQVKRMFQAVGKEVLYLKRLSMGGLRLDETLEPGMYRTLSDEEIASLKLL